MPKQVATIKNILNWVDQYPVTFAAIVIGLFFIFHYINRPKVKALSNVVYVEGKVADYAFPHKPNRKLTPRQYDIWLDNYACTFQIKTDYLSYFYRSRFERDVKKGDSIKLAIPKVYENKLQNKRSNIPILSSSKDSSDYLRLSETIPKENNPIDIYTGLLFLTAGGIYYLLKKNSIIA